VTGLAALAVVPAFGVDTFLVAVGMGATGQGDARLAWVAAAFEGAMPLAGAAVGNFLGSVVPWASKGAATAILVLLAFRQLVEAIRERREAAQPKAQAEGAGRPVSSLPQVPTAWGLVALGLSVSLDELAAGVAAGVAHLPWTVLAPSLALQAALATGLGLRAGSRLRRWAGRYGELTAGLALLAAAAAVALA
jgi:putative Mn2+ efflux pump MntP